MTARAAALVRTLGLYPVVPALCLVAWPIFIIVWHPHGVPLRLNIAYGLETLAGGWASYLLVWRVGARGKGVDLRPQESVVTAPVWAGIGTACLGLAAAIQMVIAPIPGEPWGFGSTPLLLACWASVLAFGLYRLSRTTRVLYDWAGRQAAAAAEAQADSERTTLAALQTKMNPLFLFNTLDTVVNLADTDTPKAERMVEHLSRVLRRGLERSTRPLMVVEEELQFVREYLDVLRDRLGSRLTVSYRLEPTVAMVRVPTGCLQAVVEASVKFAVLQRSGDGHIDITTERAGEAIRLIVEDDRPLLEPSVENDAGVGQARRLVEALCPETGFVESRSSVSRTRVTITLPAVGASGPGL